MAKKLLRQLLIEEEKATPSHCQGAVIPLRNAVDDFSVKLNRALSENLSDELKESIKALLLLF